MPTQETRPTTCNIHCTVSGSSIACASSAPYVEQPVGAETYQMRDGFFAASGTIGADGAFSLQFPPKISPTYPPDQEGHVHGQVTGAKVDVDQVLFLSRRNAEEAHTTFAAPALDLH